VIAGDIQQKPAIITPTTIIQQENQKKGKSKEIFVHYFDPIFQSLNSYIAEV